MRLHVRRHTRLRGCAVVALALAASAFAPVAARRAAVGSRGTRPSSRSSGRSRKRAASRAPCSSAQPPTFMPDPEVIELAAFQPEHTKAAGAYVAATCAPELGSTPGGSSQPRTPSCSRRSRPLTASIATSSLAIWGVESRYGTEMGSRNVIRSLATLAMADVRRAPFWTKELIAALRMVQDGAVQPEKLVGSWAGAMGHTQFIPSTYSARAVDFDKDGRRDIWETVADALASSANYLQASGWVGRTPVGLRGYPAAGLRLCLVGSRTQQDACRVAGCRGEDRRDTLRSGAQGSRWSSSFLPGREGRHSWSRAISGRCANTTSPRLTRSLSAISPTGSRAARRSRRPGRWTTRRSTGPSARSCKVC